VLLLEETLSLRKGKHFVVARSKVGLCEYIINLMNLNFDIIGTIDLNAKTYRLLDDIIMYHFITAICIVNVGITQHLRYLFVKFLL